MDAHSLLQADCWGHQSHGVLRMSWYLERLKSGVMSPVTRMRTVRDKAAVAVLDGQDDVGEIYLTRQRREPIPTGWALDTNGAPITDPQAAIDGLILPMAHHKGYAIAALMDVLSEMFSIPGEAALNRRQADS